MNRISSTRNSPRTAATLALCLLAALSAVVHGQETKPSTLTIDLPAALRLAGAQNLDVQIAAARSEEARAAHQRAVLQFFPWIEPGITYRAHEDNIQDVQGNIIQASKHSYAPGATVGLHLELGEAIYRALAARQLSSAANHALEAQRQESLFTAAQAYFQLALAHGAAGVASEAVRISGDYEAQLKRAVEAGLAFEGDLLRVRVQSERDAQALQQAREQERIAASRLAQVLRLDPLVTLKPSDSILTPLSLIEPGAQAGALVSGAIARRPELKQSQSAANAARENKNVATYGPLVPTLSAQAFWGGLGGGRDGASGSFGGQQDYAAGLHWRIGAGGLLDFARVREAKAQLRIAELSEAQLRDAVAQQVIEQFTRWKSLEAQLATTKRALSAAEEGFRLAQQRKEFAVGVVLETIQSEQDLTNARLEYLRVVAEYNTAQYALRRATGAFTAQ